MSVEIYTQHHQVTKVIICKCSVDTSSMCVRVCGGGEAWGGGGDSVLSMQGTCTSWPTGQELQDTEMSTHSYTVNE